MEEIWKDVVGYEGIYKVSNIGRVCSLVKNTRIFDKDKKIMRQKLDNHGYFRVNLHLREVQSRISKQIGCKRFY